MAAASIDRISAEAGFSRGAFYANYASKHALLLDLLAQHQHDEIAAWQELLDVAGSLEMALPLLRARFDAFAQGSDDLLFMAELQNEALRNPDFAARYRDYAREIGERTRSLGQAFIARAGGSRVSAEVLGIALQTFSAHLIAQGRLGLGPQGTTPGERLVAMIVELMRAPPGGPDGEEKLP